MLAFNGSPRGKNGNTEKILQPFLEGMSEAGASAEILYLKDLSIRECLGCYACHMRTPGICAIKDDMEWVLEKMMSTDIIVFATPLYVFTVSAYLKTLMDRMMILGDLKIIVVNGRTAHPPRRRRSWARTPTGARRRRRHLWPDGCTRPCHTPTRRLTHA